MSTPDGDPAPQGVARPPELYFPKPIFVLGTAHPTEPVPQGEAPQNGVEPEEKAPPPPPQLFVERAPDWRPALVAVDTHSMSLQWSPASVTVQTSEMRVVEYLLTYDLDMQLAEGDSSAETPFDLQEARWSKQVRRGAAYHLGSHAQLCLRRAARRCRAPLAVLSACASADCFPSPRPAPACSTLARRPTSR